MIGLFIGSFNPPTLAHLEICLKLKDRLDKIIFIPVNTKEKNLISMCHRINMLRIYMKDYSFLEINSIMDKYSYFDYRILDLLKKKYHNIKLIIGSDILNNMKNFTNYNYLLENYQFIVITRDSNVNNLINDKYYKYKNNFEILEYQSNISSTKARDLIKNKQDTTNILNQEIARYIKKNHLYF